MTASYKSFQDEIENRMRDELAAQVVRQQMEQKIAYETAIKRVVILSENDPLFEVQSDTLIIQTKGPITTVYWRENDWRENDIIKNKSYDTSDPSYSITKMLPKAPSAEELETPKLLISENRKLIETIIEKCIVSRVEGNLIPQDSIPTDYNMIDINGNRLIHYAIQEGKLDAVKDLLENKVSPPNSKVTINRWGSF